jgi:hypothetical protein
MKHNSPIAFAFYHPQKKRARGPVLYAQPIQAIRIKPIKAKPAAIRV